MIKVFLCKNFEDAKNLAKELKNCVAIECEYGNDVLTEDYEGVDLAFYHHGKFSNNLAPSQRYDVFDKLERGYDNFIISHVDLDTLMGIAWASKILKPENLAKEIGELIALQDTKGFHWVEKNILPNTPEYLKYRFLGLGLLINIRDIELDNGQNVVNVSKSIHKLILKIKDMIIDGPNEKQKQAIDEWLEKRIKDAERDLIYFDDKINFFVTEKNLSTAYFTKNRYAEINLCYNYRSGSIVLTTFDENIAKKYFGENGVIEPLQKYFGETAGGRISIGGSPRDQKYTRDQAENFLRFLIKEYNLVNPKLIVKKAI